MPPKQVIIDLLSSPVRLPPTKTNAPTVSTLTYKQSKPDNDGFVSLSSDTSWPADKPAPGNPTVFAGSSWNFDNLQDSSEKTKHKQAAPVVKAAGKVADFGFLEDDFDSTVNFDNSIINDLPPIKKRRLSPSPKPAPTSKSSGYNRSLSNIESSTTTKTVSKRTTSAPLKRAYTSVARLESDPILFTSSPDHFGDAARRRKEKTRIVLDSDDDLGLPGLPSGGPVQQTTKQDKGKGKVPEIFPILSSDDSSILALEPGPRRMSKDDSTNRASKSKPDFTLDASSDVHISLRQAAKPKPKPRSPTRAKPPPKPRSKSSIAMASILDQYASSDTDGQGMETAKKKPRAKPKSKDGSSQADAIIAKVKADRAKAKAAEAKTEAAEAKKAAKEAEKEEKKSEKERKAREKQKAAELATINTLRTDKKLTTPEMIVELPSCLEKKLKSQTKTFLEDVKASFTEWESSHPVVKWKRKIVAELDDEEGIWKPVPEYRRSEKHVMYVMTAKELVRHVTGDDGHDLDTLIATLNSAYESNRIIFLMEGVTAWFRKNLGIKKKEFASAVRSHGPQSTQMTASQRKKAKEDEYMDEKLVENALMELQISHGYLIHHTGAMAETAQWIKIFTENISQVPYKKMNIDTGFCMETGQVKTGESISDTYTKMLQEMVRITLPVAIGIAYEYPTVQQLIKGLERKGPTALEDCRKSANKDGAFRDRKVGKAISKRVYDVFMGKDASSWDV